MKLFIDLFNTIGQCDRIGRHSTAPRSENWETYTSYRSWKG